MKRVLLTNLFFEKYTGSELHILEMAKQFKKKGYEVTIAVFKKAYPLLGVVEDDFNIIECQNEALPEVEYEIIFVQHFSVFDYLCCKYELSYARLIVSKLSVISELEQLPVCADDADMILCVSQECADIVYKQFGHADKIRIFKNCVSEEYFQKYSVIDLLK